MSSTETRKRYLSTSEAASYIGMSKPFLDKDRCTRQQAIPFIKISRRIVYDREALDRWLAARSSDSGPMQ